MVLSLFMLALLLPTLLPVLVLDCVVAVTPVFAVEPAVEDDPLALVLLLEFDSVVPDAPTLEFGAAAMEPVADPGAGFATPTLPVAPNEVPAA
jgi:hypothetical protein